MPTAQTLRPAPSLQSGCKKRAREKAVEGEGAAQPGTALPTTSKPMRGQARSLTTSSTFQGNRSCLPPSLPSPPRMSSTRCWEHGAKLKTTQRKGRRGTEGRRSGYAHATCSSRSSLTWIDVTMASARFAISPPPSADGASSYQVLGCSVASQQKRQHPPGEERAGDVQQDA